jgi:hypothetical protein
MQFTPAQSMSSQADITVQNPQRRTILLVECAYSRDSSSAAAASLRNGLADGYLDIPSDAFFMLVLHFNLHLWKPGRANDSLPDFTADAAPVLRPYICRPAEELRWPGSDGMQFVVTSWLQDLASSIRKPRAFEAEQMLVDTGLYELMDGADVLSNFPS